MLRQFFEELIARRVVCCPADIPHRETIAQAASEVYFPADVGVAHDGCGRRGCISLCRQSQPGDLAGQWGLARVDRIASDVARSFQQHFRCESLLTGLLNIDGKHAGALLQALALLADPLGTLSRRGPRFPWFAVLWTGLASTDLALLLEVSWNLPAVKQLTFEAAAFGWLTSAVHPRGLCHHQLTYAFVLSLQLTALNTVSSVDASLVVRLAPPPVSIQCFRIRGTGLIGVSAR